MQKLYITFDHLRQNEQTGAHGCQNGVQPRHHDEVDGPASAKTLWHVIKHKHTHHERTITHDLRSLFRYFQKRNRIIQTRNTRRIAGIGPELTKITRNSHFNLSYSIPHHITGQAQSFHVLRCRRKNRWYRRAIMWHRIEDTDAVAYSWRIHRTTFEAISQSSNIKSTAQTAMRTAGISPYTPRTTKLKNRETGGMTYSDLKYSDNNYNCNLPNWKTKHCSSIHANDNERWCKLENKMALRK